jgi:hypothetical protein
MRRYLGKVFDRVVLFPMLMAFVAIYGLCVLTSKKNKSTRYEWEEWSLEAIGCMACFFWVWVIIKAIIGIFHLVGLVLS